jgi:Heterokaryon incompatibility protein (HET)
MDYSGAQDHAERYAMSKAKHTSTKNADLYCYEALPEGCIRLLEIPECAYCEPWVLTSYVLEKCPSYVCLSYTWGPPLNTKECSVEYEDGKRSMMISDKDQTGMLEVQVNLWEALERMIGKGYTGRIWVDAICINQGDLLERSCQVALMGQVFGSSVEVLVWLGKDETNLEDFSWFHENLLPLLQEHFGKEQLIGKLLPAAMVVNRGTESMKRWPGYVKFYDQHRWFHRCWILQEVALATAVNVLCGSTNLRFNAICDMATFLHEIPDAVPSIEWNPQTAPLQFDLGHKGYAIPFLRTLCQQTDQESVEWISSVTGAQTPRQWCFGVFLLMLSTLRGYQATDSKDKVYAAIGMAMKFLPPGEESIVVPDYALSVTEIYRRTACSLLENLPFLAVLSFVEDRSSRLLSDLPSWVPDFSSGMLETSYSFRHLPYPYHACTSGTLELCPRYITGSTLQLYGVISDNVTLVLETMTRSSDELEKSMLPSALHNLGICRRLLDFCSFMDASYVNGESRVEALSSTLILNQVDRQSPIGTTDLMFYDWLLTTLAISLTFSPLLDETHPSFRACAEVLQRLDETHVGTLPSEKQILEYAEWHRSEDVVVVERAPKEETPDGFVPGNKHKDKNRIHPNFGLYRRGLHRGLFLRQRLYRTSKGYIGLGPSSLQQGDQVCFLCDATVPFLMRPIADEAKYSLIGETYLHGFMNGEFFDTDWKDRIGPLYIV